MIKQKLTTLDSYQYSENIDQQMFDSLVRPWSFFQNSDISPNHSFPVQTFGSLPSMNIPEIDFSIHNAPYIGDDSLPEREYFGCHEEQSPFFMMPYLRGTSYSHQHQEVKSVKQNQSYDIDVDPTPEKEYSFQEKHLCSNTEINYSTHASKIKLKSNFNISQNPGEIQKEKTAHEHNKGYLAKNVTKNIGKLLIKYIWKNKSNLNQKLRVNTQIWSSFMSMVQEWKKENNITREFLITKWSGEDPQHKIFRTISRHFFRKHCLPSIMQSNIREKKIHIDRISKINQAITEPKAIDYLL